jgi:hypothetical protein
MYNKSGEVFNLRGTVKEGIWDYAGTLHLGIGSKDIFQTHRLKVADRVVGCRYSRSIISPSHYFSKSANEDCQSIQYILKRQAMEPRHYTMYDMGASV